MPIHMTLLKTGIKSFSARPLLAAFSGLLFVLVAGFMWDTNLSAPPIVWKALAFVNAVAAFYWFWYRKASSAAFALFAVFAVLGFLRMQNWREMDQLSSLLQAKRGVITARIAEVQPWNRENGNGVLLLENVDVQNTTSFSTGRFRLGFSAEESEFNVFACGDQIRFFGWIQPFDAPTNPGQFDYRAFSAGRGIIGRISIKRGQLPKIIEKGGRSLKKRITVLRKQISDEFGCILEESAFAWADGILLGLRQTFEQDRQLQFRRSGLAHLLAVSGLHLAVIYALLAWLLGFTSLSSSCRSVVILAALTGYAVLTGFQMPVTRAWWLVFLYLSSRIFHYHTDFLNSLLFGAIWILLKQPAALLEAGFQLSFLVTLALVQLTPIILRKIHFISWIRLRQMVAGAIAVHLAVIPLAAFHFFSIQYLVIACKFVGGTTDSGFVDQWNGNDADGDIRLDTMESFCICF